jgi:hypothetical protein
MRLFRRSICTAFLALNLCASDARAQDASAATLFSGFVTSGALARAEIEFARRPADAQNIAALGMIRFLHAVEKLGQGLHRHGLQAPGELPMVPILRLPVPVNPKPEPLTYEKLRDVYATFLSDLAAAEETLRKMPDGPVKLPVDLMAVRLDLNGDGVLSAAESLGGILASLNGWPGAAPRGAQAGPPWEVAFDRADVFWLRGYTRLLSGFLEFVLAYDWRETYGAAAHLFFAGAQDPSARAAAQDTIVEAMAGRGSVRIADLIALVHLVRWPVAEPGRLLKARDHLKAVIALSRENWKEILAETDDDREWVPGPHQKNSAFPGMSVTQERIDGWLRALDSFEEVLDGKRLVPHWRYKQGVDFSAIFTSPRPFDLVLWITGHAAIPYLKDGPIMSQQDWRQWERIFGGQFLTYAFWFN